MLNLNDITFNKRLGNLIGRSLEMPYVSYCHTFSNSKLLLIQWQIHPESFAFVFYFEETGEKQSQQT